MNGKEIVKRVCPGLVMKAVCCGLALSMIFTLTGFFGGCRDIESRLLRFHIIANSDSREDQQLKMLVRDGVTEYTDQLFRQCASKEQAERITADNLDNINSKAQQIVYSRGYDYKTEACLTKMHFDTRVYDDFTLPAGEYDALRITIGRGEGHNWWCVLYPGICVSSAEKNIGSALSDGETDMVTNSDRYVIRFRLVEWFEDIRSSLGL